MDENRSINDSQARLKAAEEKLEQLAKQMDLAQLDSLIKDFDDAGKEFSGRSEGAEQQWKQWSELEMKAVKTLGSAFWGRTGILTSETVEYQLEKTSRLIQTHSDVSEVFEAFRDTQGMMEKAPGSAGLFGNRRNELYLAAANTYGASFVVPMDRYRSMNELTSLTSEQISDVVEGVIQDTWMLVSDLEEKQNEDEVVTAIQDALLLSLKYAGEKADLKPFLQMHNAVQSVSVDAAEKLYEGLRGISPELAEQIPAWAEMPEELDDDDVSVDLQPKNRDPFGENREVEVEEGLLLNDEDIKKLIQADEAGLPYYLMEDIPLPPAPEEEKNEEVKNEVVTVDLDQNDFPHLDIEFDELDELENEEEEVVLQSEKKPEFAEEPRFSPLTEEDLKALQESGADAQPPDTGEDGTGETEREQGGKKIAADVVTDPEPVGQPAQPEKIEEAPENEDAAPEDEVYAEDAEAEGPALAAGWAPINKAKFNEEFEQLRAELKSGASNPYMQIPILHEELSGELKELQKELVSKLQAARDALRRGPDDTDPMSMLRWCKEVSMLSEERWDDYSTRADLDNSFLTAEDVSRRTLAREWVSVFENFPTIRDNLLEYGGVARLENPDAIEALRFGSSLTAKLETLDNCYQNASFTRNNVRNRDWFRADASRSFTFVVKDEHLKNLNPGELQKQLKDLQKELKATDPFWVWTNTQTFNELKEKLSSTLKTLDDFEQKKYAGTQAEARQNLLKEVEALADLAQTYSGKKEGDYAASNKSRDLRRGQAAGKILAFASAFVVNEKVKKVENIWMQNRDRKLNPAEEKAGGSLQFYVEASAMVDAVMTSMKYPVIAGCRDALARTYTNSVRDFGTGPNYSRSINSVINETVTGHVDNSGVTDAERRKTQAVRDELVSLRARSEALRKNVSAAKGKPASHQKNLSKDPKGKERV